MFIVIFFKANSLKKTLIVHSWVLGRVEKMPKKGLEKLEKYFFVLNKYESVTHVSTLIFQGLFKDIVFRSVALVTKKLRVF